MSNKQLIDEFTRLGFSYGPMLVLHYADMFQLVKSVFNGHATLTKSGRAELLACLTQIKRNYGER